MTRFLLAAMFSIPSAPALAAVAGVYGLDGTYFGRAMGFDATETVVQVLTTKGYIVNLAMNGSPAVRGMDAILYASEDCSGTPLTYRMAGGTVKAFLIDGVLEVYVIPRELPMITVAAGATYSMKTSESQCFSNTANTAMHLSVMAPNDPDVTGVRNIDPSDTTTMPLQIRMLFGNWMEGELSEEGFEPGAPSYTDD